MIGYCPAWKGVQGQSAFSVGRKRLWNAGSHGVVGATIHLAVYRAIYTEVNARLQTIAMGLGGPITFLEKEEGEKIDAAIQQRVTRPWTLWKQKVMTGK